MARISSVARRQPVSLKKAIFKKKVEKKQLRYFRRQELSHDSLRPIAPVAVELPPHSFTSSTDNTMRSVKSLTESITRSDLTVSCQQSTDRFLAGIFSPSDYQKNIESSSSEEVSHNLGLLFPLSPIPEERTNLATSDNEVVSFGNLFASEQEKKQPILPKTSDEVISLGHLFSETSENESTQSLGPLFSFPETSEQEVVSFGNLFASEKEPNQLIGSKSSDEAISLGNLFSSDSDKETTENLGALFSLPTTSEQEVVTFGNLFATSPASEQETNESLGPLFSLPETSEQEVVTFGNLFDQEEEEMDVTTPSSIPFEEYTDFCQLAATTPSDHTFVFKDGLTFDLDSDFEDGHRVCAYAPTVGVRSKDDLSSASTKSDETISLGHLFSEGSKKETTQSLGPLFSTCTISEQETLSFGNIFASEETCHPIITFPDSSDESDASDEYVYIPSTKDSLELSYVQNLPRVSETDVIYSILSDESSIRAIVSERFQTNRDLPTMTEEDEMSEDIWTPRNPRHRLVKKKTKDISTTDRVSALEMEVDHLRSEVESANKHLEVLEKQVDILAKAFWRKQNNTTAASTNSDEVLPSTSIPSVRQRAAFFESKSDTTVNAKNTAEVSKRETRTM